MKFLIIPDVHCRNFWRKTVENNINNVDKIIFLGDYLDPYADEIEVFPDTMECKYFSDAISISKMLEDIISLKRNNPDKYILLTGNHSDSYIWSKFHAATRTDYLNWEIYHKIFSENLNLFNLVYTQDDIIFSHAGITEGWALKVWEKLGMPKEEFTTIMEIATLFQDIPLKDFDKSHIEVISDISHYRDGDMFYGSCEWADFREHLDVKNSTLDNLIAKGEKGIYQIFGHTQVVKPIITDKWACLDCRQGFIFDTLTHECKDCL